MSCKEQDLVLKSKFLPFLDIHTFGRQSGMRALEFTDENCFLNAIRLINPEDRIAEIKIKPDADVAGFSMGLTGYNENKLRDSGKPVQIYPLKGRVGYAQVYIIHAKQGRSEA